MVEKISHVSFLISEALWVGGLVIVEWIDRVVECFDVHFMGKSTLSNSKVLE